jgi:hypothetical protein
MPKKIQLVFLRNLFFIFFILGLFITGPFSIAFAEEPDQEDIVAEINATKKIGLENSSPNKTVLTQISSKNIEESIAPIRKTSEKELVAQIIENAKDSHLATVFRKFPLLPVFMVRVVQDKKALPYMAKILEKKKELIYYGYAMLGTFILGFFFRRFIRIKDGSLGELIVMALLRFSLMLVVRCGITYYFFWNELDPVLNIFYKTFF